MRRSSDYFESELDSVAEMDDVKLRLLGPKIDREIAALTDLLAEWETALAARKEANRSLDVA